MSSRSLLGPALALLVLAGCGSKLVHPGDIAARLRNSPPPDVHGREAGSLPAGRRRLLPGRTGASHRLLRGLLRALHLSAAV